MKSHLDSRILLAAGLALLFGAPAPAVETASTIAFSDPSRPGTVRISLGRGELRVQGADTSEVTVKSDARAATGKPRNDGLRVISAASGFSITEKNNVVTVDAPPHELGRGSGDFRVTVPRNTTVIVQNAWGGDITCANLSGDIEINSMHGEVRLDDVAGGVVASTMNGGIRANIRELLEGKPLSFTTMNGEVLVRLPESAKANVRFRTQNGSVLTDFAENALVTKTEAVAGSPRGRGPFSVKGSGVLSAEIQEAIREAAHMSASALKEALEALKEGLEAARLSSDEAGRKLDEARRQIEQARREVERRATARAARSGDDAPAILPAPKAPLPPGASIHVPSFTISGGKLVTGTLNGGGPEISVATMNGDVILRKR